MRAIIAGTDGLEGEILARENSFFRDSIIECEGCPERLNSLAILHLHESCNWSVRTLAKWTGKNPGQISRNIRRTRETLRAALEIDARLEIEKRAGDFAGEFAGVDPAGE